ncbi:putative metalloprotease CJM1_0395 family protein [Fretibacterium fastidiosum]|uniref:SprA-related family n=1 Tax=Fretibacterium fastidiosum TaxID=651822 RepID=A0AB94IVZ3_9BACT|nr:putative metalloprotease CJM1_0395 family protein [Fretibacterium fastidiosum]CBL27902.1 SprA-related family [Fretibacterium fastidiosum]
MNVTSMLSSGYLEPVIREPSSDKLRDDRWLGAQGAVRSSAAGEGSLALQERSVLDQERALKAAAGGNAEVYTVYHYTVGADGRRYITGASVTMKGQEADLNRAGNGLATQEIQPGVPQEAGAAEADETAEAPEAQPRTDAKSAEERQKDAQVQELKQIEREVIAHEAAHMVAAGALGGGVSYTYTAGPDGKRYITGGEVPIQIQQGATPEETLRNMQQVQRAALAPADPSGQDRQVAARAAAMAAQARSEIASEGARKAARRTDATQEEAPSKAETVARGTPVPPPEAAEPDPSKAGAAAVVASVRAADVMGQRAAA